MGRRDIAGGKGLVFGFWLLGTQLLSSTRLPPYSACPDLAPAAHGSQQDLVAGSFPGSASRSMVIHWMAFGSRVSPVRRFREWLSSAPKEPNSSKFLKAEFQAVLPVQHPSTFSAIHQVSSSPPQQGEDLDPEGMVGEGIMAAISVPWLLDAHYMGCPCALCSSLTSWWPVPSYFSLP